MEEAPTLDLDIHGLDMPGPTVYPDPIGDENLAIIWQNKISKSWKTRKQVEPAWDWSSLDITVIFSACRDYKGDPSADRCFELCAKFNRCKCDISRCKDMLSLLKDSKYHDQEQYGQGPGYCQTINRLYTEMQIWEGYLLAYEKDLRQLKEQIPIVYSRIKK